MIGNNHTMRRDETEKEVKDSFISQAKRKSLFSLSAKRYSSNLFIEIEGVFSDSHGKEGAHVYKGGTRVPSELRLAGCLYAWDCLCLEVRNCC